MSLPSRHLVQLVEYEQLGVGKPCLVPDDPAVFEPIVVLSGKSVLLVGRFAAGAVLDFLVDVDFVVRLEASGRLVYGLDERLAYFLRQPGLTHLSWTCDEDNLLLEILADLVFLSSPHVTILHYIA